MNKVVYEFKIAYASEDELQTLQSQPFADPKDLVLTILPNGQPSYKTLYSVAEHEWEAVEKVEQFVSKTPYIDIPDKKVI